MTWRLWLGRKWARMGASGLEWARRLSVMEIMSGQSLTWVVWLVITLCCPPSWCLCCMQPLTAHCDLSALIGGRCVSSRHGNGCRQPCGWLGMSWGRGDDGGERQEAVTWRRSSKCTAAGVFRPRGKAAPVMRLLSTIKLD